MSCSIKIFSFLCVALFAFEVAFSGKSREHNFASERVGAYISQSSAGCMKVGEILNENLDKYLMIPKENDFKWIVVGLSEEIKVRRIELANFEFFSLHMRDFAVFGTTKHPQFCESTSGCEDVRDGWELLGLFRMEKNRDVQTFKVTKPSMVRYLRIVVMSTYGTEHYYLTLSVFRVFGSDVLEDVRDAMIAGEIEEDSSNSDQWENNKNIIPDSLLGDSSSIDPKSNNRTTTSKNMNLKKIKRIRRKKLMTRRRYLFSTKKNIRKHRICLYIEKDRYVKIDNKTRSFVDEKDRFDDDDQIDDEDVEDQDHESTSEDNESSADETQDKVQKENILTTLMQKLNILSESQDELEQAHLDFGQQSESLHVFLSERMMDATKMAKEQVKNLERIEKRVMETNREARAERNAFREDIMYFIFYCMILIAVIQVGGFCILFTQRSEFASSNIVAAAETKNEDVFPSKRVKFLERRAQSMNDKRKANRRIDEEEYLSSHTSGHFRSKSRDDGNRRIVGYDSFIGEDSDLFPQEEETKDDLGVKRSSTFSSFRNYLD